MTLRHCLAIGVTAALGACATQPPEQAGRHMLVRDGSGKLLMQFDYPTEDMCARTASLMRGSALKAACAPTSSAATLNGHATLRYNPPGVLVQGHYVDLADCRKQTGQLAAGVELTQACSAK